MADDSHRREGMTVKQRLWSNVVALGFGLCLGGIASSFRTVDITSLATFISGAVLIAVVVVWRRRRRRERRS